MMKIQQIEGRIHKIEVQIRQAKEAGNTELLEQLRLENTQLRQTLEDRRRLEQEIPTMVNECSRVYASKDTNKINAWLEDNYKPFRNYWISKVGEDVFGTVWNRVNKEAK